MTEHLTVVVHGIPAPQGSKTRLPNGGMRESSKAVRPWRDAVRWAVADAAGDWIHDRDTPVVVHIVFTLKRPAAHYRTGAHAGTLHTTAPTFPHRRPDLDKLIRSTLDGLVDAGALADDAAVVHVTAVKTYPGGDLDALDTPGATIVIRAAP